LKKQAGIEVDNVRGTYLGLGGSVGYLSYGIREKGNILNEAAERTGHNCSGAVSLLNQRECKVWFQRPVALAREEAQFP
jgi:hypothetical protein